MAKIVFELSEDVKLTFIDHKPYKNDKLLQKGSRVFQTELYPLGKKNLSTKNLTLNKFGLNEQEYYRLVEDIRFPLLYDFWKDSNAVLTICYGSTFESKFIKLFNLNESKSIVIDNMRFFNQEKIIITPFFINRHMGFKRVYKLVSILKDEWDIQF